MSSWFGMGITISGHDPKKKASIIKAANTEWVWSPKDWDDANNKLDAYAEGFLSGDGGDFAQRVQIAVWRANKKYCEIEIRATYLEELPYETYISDEEIYNKRGKP